MSVYPLRKPSALMRGPLADVGSLEDLIESPCLKASYLLVSDRLSKPQAERLPQDYHDYYRALAEVRGTENIEDGVARSLAESYCLGSGSALFDLLLLIGGRLYAVLCQERDEPVKVYVRDVRGGEDCLNRALIVVNLIRMCDTGPGSCTFVRALVEAGRFLERVSGRLGVRVVVLGETRVTGSAYNFVIGEVVWPRTKS